MTITTDELADKICRGIIVSGFENDADAERVVMGQLKAIAGTISHAVRNGLVGHTPSRESTLDDLVVPDWLGKLSFQQQSVVLLALRGPDGVRKHHPAKPITVAYRGTVLRAAERGRFLYWGELADSFMSLDVIADTDKWAAAVKEFFRHVDELPHHFVSHLAHAAQIIGYKHPSAFMRERWGYFYRVWVDDAHLNPETEAQMDRRLGDWGQAAERLSARAAGTDR